MRGLIIDEPWIGLILSGEKTWEMRRSGCSIRGPIALIRKGSGCIVGTARVVGEGPDLSTPEAYAEAEPLHRIPPARQERAFEDGWRRPWILADASPLAAPVPYRHKSGAVIWVLLDEDVAAAINAQEGGSGADMPSYDRPEQRSPSHQAPQETRMREDAVEHVGPAPGTARLITLSGGNIRNGHFYLPLDFFPDDAIGGGNRQDAARRELAVTYVPGETVQTDIDRTKRIFRRRAGVKEFFARAGLGEGDRLLITRDAPYSFTVAPDPRSR